MTNKESYIKKRRSYKNKNMRYEMVLMDSFNFTYAGKANIFISFNRVRKKFQVCVSGVHFVEDIYLFTPHFHCKYDFDSLYYAILAFNRLVRMLMENLDWYDPDLFSQSNIQNEVTVTD